MTSGAHERQAKGSLFDTPSPRVFTIPPGVSFLDCLAQTLLDELDSPETPFALSDAIILLPTKRAARALGQAFLDARGGRATLLPCIRTLGDIDPDDAGLAELGDAIDATPIIDPLARQLTLARLIRARDKQADWSDDPVAALSAANALADLLDSAAMACSGNKPFDWSALETLVQNKELASHWEQSTTFLKIVTSVWPQYLAEMDLVDPGARQRRAIEGLIENWRASPPKGAVILAGSTGSMPVTRALMACIAGLPKGGVVLPGLDRELSDKKWADARRDDQHPQRAMSEAIEHIGLDRKDVLQWPGAIEAEHLRQRQIVLNEALTPQESTADWPSRITEIGKGNIALGLQNCALIEAATEEEEANVIAMELREVLQLPFKTAALVTPDAHIARRVAAKLARWDIAIDVSAGQPLSQTPVGTFIRLVANWVSDPADPVLLSSLLAHPFSCFGSDHDELRATAAVLEVSLLRGARKDQSLEHLLIRAQDLPSKQWQLIDSLPVDEAASRSISLLTTLIQTLANAGAVTGTLDAVAQRVISLCEVIASCPVQAGADKLWRGEAGEVASQLFSGLLAHGASFDFLGPNDVARTLDALMAGRVVRPRGTHPRLAILGPLEARLLQFDKVVLAGLDEGVWPKPPPPDPFLSRSMRVELGLPAPDTRIGLSAHDFAQLASAPDVVMTRAARRNDAPVVMSRWLWRLKTLMRGALGEEAADRALAAKSNWRERLRHFEPNRTFDTRRAIPAPRPPTHARPTQFSATQIETWIRDPYRTYVEKVLQLKALDPLGGDPGAGERGTAMHTGTEIVGTWLDGLPDDAREEARAAMRRELEKAGYHGFALEVELRRLEPSVDWLANVETARLQEGWYPFIEKWGQVVLQTSAGAIKLKAKADRIDVGPEGVEVLDFKSGSPPSAEQVKTLFAAQLPVTALIIARGGYDDVDPQIPLDLRHIHVGGRNVKVVGAVQKETSVAELIENVETTIVKLFTRYADPDWAYLSKPRVQFVKATTYEDATDRLARRAEWANVEAGE